MPTLEEQIQALADQLNQSQTPTLPPAIPRRGPDDGGGGGFAGLLGDVGEVLAGGQSPNYRLSGSERSAAGNRALMNFGINMMLASGPQPYRPDIFSGLAHGLQGAQQSFDLSQRQAQAASQQDYQNRLELAKLGIEQGRDRVERVKALLPLLQMQQRSEPLPGDTSAGGGGGGGGGGGEVAFTGDREKDRAIIIARESQGNPAALNYVAQADKTAYDRGATASGLYGFTNSTWADGMKMIGGDVSKYPTARSAPKEVQDKVFDAIYAARGSDPWNPAKWGQNWQKQPDGTYALVATPKGGGAAARTGGTDVAGPPGTVPARTPPPVAQAPAQTPPAAPAAPAPVPEAMTESDARTAAAKTGKPVPLLGQDGKPSGMFMMPNGNMSATGGGPDPTPQNPAPAAEPSGQDMGLPPGVPTWKRFQELNPITFTPEQQAAWGTDLAPEVEARLKAARDRLDLDERIARERERRGEQGAGDAVNKAVENQAKHALEEEKLRKEARDKGNENRRLDMEKALDRLRDQHKELISGAETRLTNKEAVVNRANETGLTDAQKEMKQARDVGVQLQGFADMTESIAQPGWLQTTRNPFGNGETVAEKLQQLGLKVDDTGATQLLRGGMVNLTRTLREGMPMGALSDRDLTFIERMGPTEWMDKDTRMAAIGYLRQAFAAKQKFAAEIHKNMSKGMNYSDAFDAADAKIGKDFVPRVPENISQHWEDKSPDWVKARNKWIRENAPPGTFYHLWDGSIMVQRR